MSLILGRLIKFLSLKRSEKILLLRAFLLLGIVQLALWFLLLKTIQKLLLGTSSTIADIKFKKFAPDRIAWAVTIASSYVPRATCLTQALATQLLLANHGYHSNLQIGVAKGDIDQLEAHAWLECDGRVVMGGSDIDRYTILPLLAREKQ